MTQPGQSDRVSQGGEGHIVRAERIEAASLGPATWSTYRKRTITRAVRVGPLPGPHIVATKEGDYHLSKGWEGAIAADADGDLYPIAKNVFDQTYELIR